MAQDFLKFKIWNPQTLSLLECMASPASFFLIFFSWSSWVGLLQSELWSNVNWRKKERTQRLSNCPNMHFKTKFLQRLGWVARANWVESVKLSCSACCSVPISSHFTSAGSCSLVKTLLRAPVQVLTALIVAPLWRPPCLSPADAILISSWEQYPPCCCVFWQPRRFVSWEGSWKSW